MNSQLERYRNILDFTLSSLKRRKGKNLSLLLVYTLVVFVISSLLFFTQSLKREAALILADAPDLVVQRMVAGRHDPIPDGYAEKIAAIRGVSAVATRVWGYYYDAVSGANFTLVGEIGPRSREGEGEPGTNSSLEGEGGVGKTMSALPSGCIRVGSGLARICKLSKGDMFSLKDAKGMPTLFEVKEIMPADSELVAADLIQMREDDLRAFFGFPRGRSTDLAVSVRNKAEIPTVASKIVQLYPDSRPILKSEMLRTYDSLFDWRGGMLVVVLSSVLLSFVIFAWDRATGLSAEERREIGILKSIGWETGDVLLLKSWEGIVISLTAFLVGTILAYLHVFFFSATLFEPALKGWSVLYPQFRLAPEVDLFQLSVLFFLTVGPYTAATVVPSWLAATVDPDAAMRN